MMDRSTPLVAALLLLAACGRSTEDVAAQNSAATDPNAVAPAIVSPDEEAVSTEPPSYEVSIATAASQHNAALERCAKQPEAVRAQCEQEANAVFAETEASLQDLRGNQP